MRLGRTPGLATRADAGSGLTVVAGRGGAVDGDVAASVSQGAEAGVGDEGVASAAVVVSGATRGDANASSLGRTPGLSVCADAVTAMVVVFGTFNGDNSALV